RRRQSQPQHLLITPRRSTIWPGPEGPALDGRIVAASAVEPRPHVLRSRRERGSLSIEIGRGDHVAEWPPDRRSPHPLVSLPPVATTRPCWPHPVRRRPARACRAGPT